MRKIVKMISILVVVLVLAGCGKRELSLEEIKLDVEKFSDIPMEGNEITKFEIIKRQTNIKEKKDTVYVHIEAENEDFFVVRNYKLEYFLYNEGWMLENYSSYTEDGYYDRTIALHGVDMEVVEEYFEWACDHTLYKEPAFSDWCNSSFFTGITNNYFESNVDSYTKVITLDYGYFLQEVIVNVDYILNGFSWEPNMYVTENIMLSDNISGEWEAYVEASHPLFNDSKFFGTITKIDELNCNYQFIKTSAISGGEDKKIEGTNAIKMMYDSEGNLEYIELGKALLDYKLRIIPEGIAWVWTGGKEEIHILYR